VESTRRRRDAGDSFVGVGWMYARNGGMVFFVGGGM